MMTRKGLWSEGGMDSIAGAKCSAEAMVLAEELPCQRFAQLATICRLMRPIKQVNTPCD